MSSCFLCDTSYTFVDRDSYNIIYSADNSENHYMKYMPIMIGSTGMNKDDRQHENGDGQNYVSYRVKKIEFRSSVRAGNNLEIGNSAIPDYIVLFKVPFREPIFDYNFGLLKSFMLFTEPECVLKYGVYSRRARVTSLYPLIRNRQWHPNKFDLILDKPFIVGPNDYVGVFYMFYERLVIDSSAKVWFDVV